MNQNKKETAKYSIKFANEAMWETCLKTHLESFYEKEKGEEARLTDTCLVAEGENGALLGYLLLRKNSFDSLYEGGAEKPETDLWVRNLLILRPEDRRKGLGRALVEEAERWGQKIGTGQLAGMTFSPQGFDFWRALGYSATASFLNDRRHRIVFKRIQPSGTLPACDSELRVIPAAREALERVYRERLLSRNGKFWEGKMDDLFGLAAVDEKGKQRGILLVWKGTGDSENVLADCPHIAALEAAESADPRVVYGILLHRLLEDLENAGVRQVLTAPILPKDGALPGKSFFAENGFALFDFRNLNRGPAFSLRENGWISLRFSTNKEIRRRKVGPAAGFS